MEETQKKSKATLWSVLVLVLAAVTFGAFKLTKDDANTPADTNSANNTTPNEETPVTETDTYMYKDGSYSAVGTYTSPAGPEEVAVTISLKDDVITNATVISKASNEVSVKLQGMFIGGFKALVVGKSIEDVVLDKVAGSSLTPKGWNDAVIKIQTQAKIQS
ncbi:MAG: calcium-binding protein [Patescibacteria group bacterium]